MKVTIKRLDLSFMFPNFKLSDSMTTGEYDIVEPVESVKVQLESEAIEIRRNPDTNEIMVIHHIGHDTPEIILSILEEEKV